MPHCGIEDVLRRVQPRTVGGRAPRPRRRPPRPLPTAAALRHAAVAAAAARAGEAAEVASAAAAAAPEAALDGCSPAGAAALSTRLHDALENIHPVLLCPEEKSSQPSVILFVDSTTHMNPSQRRRSSGQ